MIANQSHLLSFPQLFDTLRDGVLYFRPVRAEGSLQILDFIIDYANPAMIENAQALYRTEIGTSVQQDNQLHPEITNRIFARLNTLVETGKTEDFEFHNQPLNEWLSVSCAKAGDGVLSIVRNITASKEGALTTERQSVENQRQTNILNNILDASSNGIVAERAVRDAAGTIVDFQITSANRQAAEIVQSTVDALVGRSELELHPELRSSGLFDAYVRTVETGEPQFLETHYNDGRLDYWIQVNTRKLAEEELVITFSNVSDVKRAQQAVERQANLLTSVLDSSNSGIIAFESIRNEQGVIVDFRFTTVNEACERLLLYPLETMRGNTLLTLFPGNVETGLFALYVNTAQTGEPGRTEVYYNHDGLDFWLDISAQQLGDGFVVTFTDISEMKRAAIAVEQSAAELQTVVDTAQTGIFLFEPVRDETGEEVVDFRFRLANRQLASYVGQEPEAVINTVGSRWFPDYKTNGLFDAYRDTYLTGVSRRFDMHYVGSRIDVWLDIMVTKVGDGVLVTFGDYTLLKKLQQALESSVIDLQRSNANLEQFAYVASHDLQEPLRKIQSFGDIIETQYGPVIGDEGADMIRRMQSAAARMQVLIKDVLAYSRIATRRDAVKSVDLSHLVADVITDLETAIADQQATVQVDPLPVVAGDAVQLHQLFQNLLSNALKFRKPRPAPDDTDAPMLPGALIRLTARTTRGCDSGLDISPVDADRSFHLIELTDNGIGFDPHQAERIFQVFQRLHSRSRYQGTGIGLAIVKKVVENHSGYIQAVGRPGEGATFRLLLPA